MIGLTRVGLEGGLFPTKSAKFSQPIEEYVGKEAVKQVTLSPEKIRAKAEGVSVVLPPPETLRVPILRADSSLPTTLPELRASIRGHLVSRDGVFAFTRLRAKLKDGGERGRCSVERAIDVLGEGQDRDETSSAGKSHISGE